MGRLLLAFTILFLAACSSTPPPKQDPYDNNAFYAGQATGVARANALRKPASRFYNQVCKRGNKRKYNCSFTD